MPVMEDTSSTGAPTTVVNPERGYKWFESHYDMVEQDWRNRRQRYRSFYKMLVAKAGANPTAYLSNIRSHLVQQQVNTYQAFLLTALLPTFPYVHAETVEPFRTWPWFALESACTEEINARLRTAHFYAAVSDWIRSATIHGVGILKLQNGQFRVVDPSNFAWDLACNGNIREDCSYVIERLTHLDMMTVKALWQNDTFNKLDGKKFKKLLETAPHPDDTGDYNADKEFRYRERLYSQSPRVWGEGLYKRIEIHEVTTPSKRMWVNRQTGIVLGEKDNELGYINYYALQPFPETGEVQGWAVPEMLEDIQVEMNANLAQSTDNASLASNVMVKLARSSGLDPYNMRVQPGKVFPVNSMDDLDFFQPAFHGRELSQHRGELQLESDKIIGIMAHTRGEAGPSSMKATVSNQINTNVNVRLNATANMINDVTLRALMNDFMRMAALDPNPVKVIKEEWEAIKGVINMGVMEMTPHAESYVGNQMAKQQQLMNLLQMLAPLGILQQRGLASLIQEIIGLSGVRDPERMTQDLVPYMPQDMQAGQEALGMGGEGTGAPDGSQMGIQLTQNLAQGAAAGQSMMPAAMQL